MNKLYHPDRWGKGYYLNLFDSWPFIKVEGGYLELSPIKPDKGWKPRFFKDNEVEIVF